MEAVRAWLLQIVAAALFLTLAQALMPKGVVKDLCRLMGGLILFCVIVSPMLRGGLDGLGSYMRQYQDELSFYSADLEEADKSLLEGIMSEKTSEYIVTEAEALGADVTAEITCAWEDDLPIPSEVTIRGSLTSQMQTDLSARLVQDLAIAPESIHYEE